MIIPLYIITFSKNTCIDFTEPREVKTIILYLFEMFSGGKSIDRESRLVVVREIGESGNWGAIVSKLASGEDDKVSVR